MFGWFKNRPKRDLTGEIVVAQPHGEIFPWPKGAVLTAVDELVLALPIALLDEDRSIGTFIFAHDDAELNIPPEGDTFMIRLKPGMSVSLAKSVQSYVVSEDQKPRRIKVKRPPASA